MRPRAVAWIVCLAVVLLLTLSASDYSQTANLILISIRVALIAALSILVLRERWKYRHDPQGTGIKQDAGDTILRRVRRWYYDDK